MLGRRLCGALTGSLVAVSTLVAVTAPAAGGAADLVILDDGAAATASATVTVEVPPPTDSAATLRLSDDGGTTWTERAWSTSFDFSLIDPAAGGQDVDGTHTVTVEGGDAAGGWASLGSASILLDRTGPTLSQPYLDPPTGIGGYVRADATDAGVGVDRVEISLDDVHWRRQYDWQFGGGALDMRESAIGGSWEPGPRTVYVRAVDELGNITEADPITRTVNATDVRTNYGNLPATFTFPRPAITGHPFTIAPTYDDGYTVPAGDFCIWELTWGDFNGRALPKTDPNYGEIYTSVPPQDGVCTAWTFTLPYTPPLQYAWSLMIGVPTDEENTHSVTATTQLQDGFFRAEGDGTSRAVAESNLPLVYMLPDRDYANGPVTYRLYSVGGAKTSGGSWSCIPSKPTPNGPYGQQDGGDTFTCPVSTSEPWVTTWNRDDTLWWRVRYDPVGDLRKPVVQRVLVTPAQHTQPQRGKVRADVRWASTDRGTGVKRYALERSLDGGRWHPVALEHPRVTAYRLTLSTHHDYRFRVRAVDYAGNRSGWRDSRSVRARVTDDSTSQLTWSTGWTRAHASRALGHHVHTTTRAGATARLRFTGSALGLVASRGPAKGWVQLYVDGTLAATVNLHAASSSAPTTVWSHSWPRAGSHVLKVRNLGTTGHPGLAVDAFTIVD